VLWTCLAIQLASFAISGSRPASAQVFLTVLAAINLLGAVTLHTSGQPIAFVAGIVPIANVQTFVAGASLSYTLGTATVTASSASPACPAPLAGAVTQLFGETADSRSVRQATAAMISNPNFLAWMNEAKALGSRLTPFETSLLDAGIFVANNADLLGDPRTMTASQQARLPGFLASILGNPAVIQLRLAGDALKGSATAIGCNTIAAVNAGQVPRPILSPQPGSVYEQALALGQSTAHNLQNAMTNVASGAQKAALLGAPGLLLAAMLPADQLVGLQVSGTIPTGSLSVIKGAVLGAAIGATAGAISGGIAGFIAGGPMGAVAGAIAAAAIGAIVGGVIGAVAPDAFTGDCQNCTGGAFLPGTCGDDNTTTPPTEIQCVGGCCAGSNPPIISISFLTGTACPNAAPSCHVDRDCASGRTCLQNCCIDTATFCQNSTMCATDANCGAGNTCHFGCCIGHCGLNGTSCDEVPAATCAPAATCGGGKVCTSGCCAFPIVP
jgi:hypothetical protein